MIIGMVTCMSLFGLLMEGQMLSLSAYFQAWGLNFIVALPYQLLIVGPFFTYDLNQLPTTTNLENRFLI